MASYCFAIFAPGSAATGNLPPQCSVSFEKAVLNVSDAAVVLYPVLPEVANICVFQRIADRVAVQAPDVFVSIGRRGLVVLVAHDESILKRQDPVAGP